MSLSKFLRGLPALVVLVATAIACSDSRPAGPDKGADPLAGLVQVQSPDTTRGGGGTSTPQGDGFFRGAVKGFNEADYPDTLKSVKPLAGVVATAYTAELTTNEPKLGPAASVVTTNADGQFTFPTLRGGLYVVTFVPPAGSSYESGWTMATAHSRSGDLPWVIMLRAKK